MRGLACFCVLAACGGGSGDSSWTPVANPTGITNAIRIWAFSPTNVWLLDGTNTVQRYDGSAWSAMPTPSTSGLSCIYGLTETDVWLCADDAVWHYDGTNFTTMTTGLTGQVSLWASSDSDLWIVGMDANVGHYNGTSWTRTVAGSPNKNSIWGSAPNDIYAVGVFDLQHYDGATWSKVTVDSFGGDQVWGTSGSDVWVMTGESQVSHYDGAAWMTSDLNITGQLSAVWGPAPNDLWAAGSGGAIAHYNGKTWSEASHQPIGAPYLDELLSVHGTATDDIWIVGHELGQGGAKALVYHGP